MDPVSGVLALAGITAASVLGLRWQRSVQEGFAVLPGPEPTAEDIKIFNDEKNTIETARRVVTTDKQKGIVTPQETIALANRSLPTLDTYPDSVATSQSRYNMFSGLINPINNPLIPVGSSPEYIEETKKKVINALGTFKANFSKKNNNTLVIEDYTSKYPARSENERSVFNAIQFCREAGKQENPFSDGKKPAAKSKDGVWNFDEICGVCLTGGTDEEGKQFFGKRGLVYDPNTRDADISLKERKGYPFVRAKPTLGFCGGAPDRPVFATNGEDLKRFTTRSRCQAKKVIGGEDNCAYCFEHDVYSSVPTVNDSTKGVIAAATYTITLVVQGIGEASVTVNNRKMNQFTLDNTKATRIELVDGKEGSEFGISVGPKDISRVTEQPTLFGYIESSLANGGVFRYPLNLLLTKDGKNSNKSPNKSGGFYFYKELGMEVAKIQPARVLITINDGVDPVSNRPITREIVNPEMDLRGTLPFTFVQRDEFSAYDCPSAPYLTKQSSINAFSTDQPCFTKGSGPGNYSEECLKGRVLDAGCTSQGDLYKDALKLNNLKLSLEGIYDHLKKIQSKDMISPEETKMCSGRAISSPCDAFVMNPSKKFLDIAFSTDKETAPERDMARKCLSFLYNNKGAAKGSSTTDIGPTYSGLMTFQNNTKERKNIVCLPDGLINPDKSETSLRTLATYADNGYTPRKDQRRLYGVKAVQAFLNDEFEMAVDWSRNANTDITRKAAIKNCFGPDLSKLPLPDPTEPTMQEDECGIVARYVRVLPSTNNWENFIEISQLVVIDKTGTNVALKKSTEGTSPPYTQSTFSLTADKAVDGNMFPRRSDFYHSEKAGQGQQFIVDLGKNFDITRIIYFYRNEPGLLYRKNGIRLQLLNEKREVVNERRLNANMIEEINYLQEGAPNTCKSFLTAPALPTLPQGYSAGMYGRFFKLTSGYPALPTSDLLVGKSIPTGWTGQRLGTPTGFTSISLDDGYFGSMNLPESDFVGFVARGFYFANQPQELYFRTESDDGVVVTFNGIKVIDNWVEQAKTGRESVPLMLPTEGAYPIEIYWFERGGAATLRLYWRRSDQSEWQTDLSKFFGYNATSEKDIDEQYTRNLRDAEEKRIRAQREAEFSTVPASAAVTALVVNSTIRNYNQCFIHPTTLSEAQNLRASYDNASIDWMRNRICNVYYKQGMITPNPGNLDDRKPEYSRGVVLFTDPNYGGRSFLVAPGDYPWVESIGIPNDSISSAYVPPGYRVILYQHWFYGGSSVTLTADTPNLVTMNFDNAMSSMRVQRI